VLDLLTDTHLPHLSHEQRELVEPMARLPIRHQNGCRAPVAGVRRGTDADRPPRVRFVDDRFGS
jgi:hypothetical protein